MKNTCLVLLFALIVVINSCSETDKNLLSPTDNIQKASIVYHECQCEINMLTLDGENLYSPIEDRSSHQLAAINISDFIAPLQLLPNDTLNIEFVFVDYTVFDCLTYCDIPGGLNIELKAVTKE